MSDKKDSEDSKAGQSPEAGARKPGEGEPPVAGAEETPAARRDREESVEAAAEALSETDPAAPAEPGYDPDRPETDAEGAAPLGEDPAKAREAEDAEILDAAEADREAELAAGLEERGSDAEPEAEPEPERRLEDEPEPEPYADEHEEHEEHHRPGLAARALQGLVLLLIGGGVALWGAPKIAPHVPEPVSRYLSAPNAVEQADLAALRADLEARLAERQETLSARIEEVAAGPDVESALAPVRERLDALAGEVEQAGGAAPERVASVENAVADLRAQLESLQGSLSGLGEGAGDAPPELAERVQGFNAVVESLRAELASVSSRTEELAARLEQAEARFEEETSEAQAAAEAAAEEARAAQRRAALTEGFRDLTVALEEGAPFAGTLDRMSAFAEPPEALAAAAGSGVVALAELRERFTAAGRRAMQAERLSQAGEGTLDRAFAAIRGSLEGVPVDEVQGEGLEAALGRAAARLRDGELAAALEALEGASDPAKEAMSGWLSDARARRDAVQAARGWRESLLGGA